MAARHTFLLLLIGMLCLGPLQAAGAQTGPSRYVVRDLGVLPGDSQSAATGINDQGQVVGVSQRPAAGKPQPLCHAFLWQNGRMTRLSLPGADNTWATTLNNRGQVIGQADGPAGALRPGADAPRRAFLFFKGQVKEVLKPATGEFVTLSGINDQGEVLGDLVTPGKPVQAFLWRDEAQTLLPLTGGSHSLLGIDNAGGVVYSQIQVLGPASSTQQVFLWRNGQAHRISSLPGYMRFNPAAMYGRGDVLLEGSVRQSYQAGFERDFLWTGGRIKGLKTAYIGTLIDGSARVDALNDAQQAVGLASRTERVLRRVHTTIQTDFAFLYNCRTGRIDDLNRIIAPGSGWMLQEATGINNRGWIVGIGRRAGRQHAFLLRPAPALPMRRT